MAPAAAGAADAASPLRQLLGTRTQQKQAETVTLDDDDKIQFARDQRDQPRLHASVSPPPPDTCADLNAASANAPLAAGVSLSAGNAAALDGVRRNATCGICSSLVASSLVLSCGHMFCGSCLFDFLNQRPSCPTCQVSLRAIPVRCLALDGVVEALSRVLTKAELGIYHARVDEGKSAANKLNKMFWWLQPAAIPALVDSHGHQGTTGSANIGGASASALTMAMLGGGPGPAANSRPRAGTGGGAASSASPAWQMQPRQSLDSHPAAVPPHQAPPHLLRPHHQGNQLHPGLLGCSPMGPSSHQVFDDTPLHGAAFAHNLTMGNHQPIHQPQGQRHVPPAGYGIPRAHRNPLPQAFLPAMGLQQQQQQHGGMQGMEGANLCNMAALGLAPPMQQQVHGVTQQLQYFDFAAASAQMGQLQPCAQLPQLSEYVPHVQASSQSEHMENLHTQVQLQNLLRSLSIGEWP